MKGMQDYYIPGTYTCRCGKVILTSTVFLDASVRVVEGGPHRSGVQIVASDIRTDYFDGTEKMKVKFDNIHCPGCGEFIDIARHD